MGEVQAKFETLDGCEIESGAGEILAGLGIITADLFKLVEDFSGGWKMRIALAKVLIVMPGLILMDEVTNYLDMETILWLEKWLKSFKGAILMTSHDREFIARFQSRASHAAQVQSRVKTFEVASTSNVITLSDDEFGKY